MKKLVAVVLAAWFGFSFAQDTESCAPLLETLQAEAEEQQALWSGIQSVAQQTDIAQTIEGQAFALTTNAVYDLENRRIYQSIVTDGQETMALRYADGEAVMTIPGMDMDMPAPPEMMEPLEQQLEQILDGNFGGPAAMWGETEIVSCDGVQQYGDVLGGEQVTVRLTQGVMADTLLQFVFVEGQLEGVIQEIPQLGPTLTVFEELTTNSDGLTERLTTRQYSWDGSQAQETGLTTISYSYNEPIDEALFAP